MLASAYSAKPNSDPVQLEFAEKALSKFGMTDGPIAELMMEVLYFMCFRQPIRQVFVGGDGYDHAMSAGRHWRGHRTHSRISDLANGI